MPEYESAENARVCVSMLALHTAHGCTAFEIEEALDKRGGAISGCLSTLHKQGKVARLTEKRLGRKVYVLPEYVNGRDTEPQGRDLLLCSNCRADLQ